MGLGGMGWAHRIAWAQGQLAARLTHRKSHGDPEHQAVTVPPEKSAPQAHIPLRYTICVLGVRNMIQQMTNRLK